MLDIVLKGSQLDATGASRGIEPGSEHAIVARQGGDPSLQRFATVHEPR